MYILEGKLRVAKWGNSLALRIPKSFATETALDPGAEVDLTLEEGRLVITPRRASAHDLAELLAHVTPENLHHEVDAGSSVGTEAW